jgi:hypothetical protein
MPSWPIRCWGFSSQSPPVPFVTANQPQEMSMTKVAVKAAWAWLRSPQATRLEIALAVGLLTAIQEALKHA